MLSDPMKPLYSIIKAQKNKMLNRLMRFGYHVSQLSIMFITLKVLELFYGA